MNQKMLEYLGEHADKYPNNLEQKYPHVFQKMIELWGTVSMRPYFDELIMSNRPNRLGFPPEVVTEIWAQGEVALLRQRAEAAGLWPPPPGWLPPDARGRALILQGRPPPDPR